MSIRYLIPAEVRKPSAPMEIGTDSKDRSLIISMNIIYLKMIPIRTKMSLKAILLLLETKKRQVERAANVIRWRRCVHHNTGDCDLGLRLKEWEIEHRICQENGLSLAVSA